ncbi:MAG: type II toxin-antitoxin system Phd/YefM family antitoxin [Holophagales bacterium]|nr:type II toxin-antitoxin system Phd/YefM family antitoxin [Holophagales bacterium]MYF94206.1 type II toxin-antitoxin system Phd/YefM family antitoxin [Holophagales bacterium]
MKEASPPRAHSTQLPKDVVPLGDVKVNPDAVVQRAARSGRPILLTSRGRGVAVLQSLEQYEAEEEERSFLRSVAQGLASAEDGRQVSLAEAKAIYVEASLQLAVDDHAELRDPFERINKGGAQDPDGTP